ncbi:MAG: DNA modification methylase [Candidatus Colwellbacteria bacterium]|nr:DNA modification methylase [Candidatus Colwellbacteria bacterium]
MSDKQIEGLKKSLRRFNLVEIPAIDKDNRIIAGHQRIKALQLLDRGEESIEVRVPNRKLTQKEYEQYLLTSNAVIGDWDYEKLKLFDLDFLVDVGFDPIEIAPFWDKDAEVIEENFDVEKELKRIKEVQTKPGDLIILGKHKLICGDSTNLDVLAKLFGEDRASMIYSDPIYNIDIDYNGGIGGKQNYGGSVIDSRSDQEYRDLIKSSLVNALAYSKEDVHVFYWSDQTYIWLIQTLYKELGIQNKRVCLWIKNGHNPTPLVAFNKAYEPCTYGVRGRPYIAKDIQNLNEVMNKETTTGNNMLDEISDIWAVKRLAGRDYEHATSKPPQLHQKAILRCTKPGDIILDSFSGSGSTLIAAEQLKRRVYAVELEPVFCDLTIRRFEKLTGLKAEVMRGDEKR